MLGFGKKKEVAQLEKTILQLENKNAKLSARLDIAKSEQEVLEHALAATQDEKGTMVSLLYRSEKEREAAERQILEMEETAEVNERVWQRRLRMTVTDMLPVDPEDNPPA